MGALLGLNTLVPYPAVTNSQRVVLVATCSAMVAVLIVAGWKRIVWGSRESLLFGVYAVSAVGLLGTGTGLNLAVLLAFTFLSCGTLLVTSELQVGEIHSIARIVLLLAWIQLIYAFLEAYLNVEAPWGYLGMVRASTVGVNPLLPGLPGRALGTLSQPIPLATLEAVAFAFLLAMPRLLPAIARFVSMGGFLFGIFLSGTRSALLAVSICVLFEFMFRGPGWSKPFRGVVSILLPTVAIACVGPAGLPFFNGLAGSFSASHRLGAYASVGRLLGRSTKEALLGSGYGSLRLVFEAGFLQSDGVEAVDSQLVYTLAVSGLLGVLLLIAFLWLGVRRSHPDFRAALVVLLVMMFSFDLMAWPLPTFLLLFVLAARSPTGKDAHDCPSGRTNGAGAREVNAGKKGPPGVRPVETQE